ncbi:MAG: hypothetical protein NT145_04985 [Elusimicrobia bacterium]|nr:hypothetical protein [Elusimicrobiota bacterium]
MQENVRLLMEETNCEQGEAELALELAENDLEKAIKTIGSILKQIFAIKGKFFLPSKNLYGLFLIVLNTKSQSVLRLHIVVSYNPALYENSAAMDWYALEKLIFYYRLDEGSLPDFTQDIEQKLKGFISNNKEIFAQYNTQNITALLTNFFAPDSVEISLVAEELNLAQFRQLPKSETETSKIIIDHEKDPSLVHLAVEVMEDINGKEISKLSEGDVVLTLISDTRDIAHYLAHLIGGRREGIMIPLPAVIKKISPVSLDLFEIQVYYSPGIIGETVLGKGSQVKLIETKTLPWWKKIIPWT